MNPSNSYNRDQRRNGKFVITKTVSMAYTPYNRWERLLTWLRIKEKKKQKVQFYLHCNPEKTGPDWVLKLKDATPFDFELAHRFIKELELKDAAVKLVGKFEDKLIAV